MKSFGKSVLLLLIFSTITAHVKSTQINYTGSDRINTQTWKLEFTIEAPDSFCVRFPYPDYTMQGRWASYATENIEIDVNCEDVGPYYWNIYHYNEGYCNQGVWVKVYYPSGPMIFSYEVTQSTILNLPGIDYPMYHYTNNGWMDGSEIVDVCHYRVEEVLAEAQTLDGDWHVRGFWSEPEKIVNWLNQNMAWEDDNRYEPWQASYVLNPSVRCGNCDEWAHAACALLLKAGIPARVAMVGTTDGFNATNMKFENAISHLCLSYWDGFGWIMIDPQSSSGFTFICRVFLGADRDSKGVRIETSPEYLVYQIYNSSCSCENGYQYGYLHEECYRCSQYPWEILEHYEKSDENLIAGTEPQNCVIPGDVVSVDEDIIQPYRLIFENYPNPFNPMTIFRFFVIEAGKVSINIYSVDGRLLETVVDEEMSPGEKNIPWSSEKISSGIYLAKVVSPSGESTRKLVIMK